MSLASIKAKEKKTKDKQKASKLRSVLANPIKEKCPSLTDEDFLNFIDILRKAISNFQENPKLFLNANKIHLGLASSLRCINNDQASCVFISRNIQPRYLLGLIARNVETRDAKIPVYVQPQLEETTKKIFGVQALAMVFPSNMETFDQDIINWILAHQKPEKTKHVVNESKINIKSKNVKNVLKIPQNNGVVKKELELKEKVIKKDFSKSSHHNGVTSSKTKSKDFSSDYISFSGETKIFQPDSEDDNELVAVLPKITKESANKKEIEKESDSAKDEKKDVYMEDSNSDSDDFLNDFKPLKVYKVCGNPNKKPKKKKKKQKS